MQTFDELKRTLDNVKLIARGSQKTVYSANHFKFGAIVVKLFFKIDSRSLRELSIGYMEIANAPEIFDVGEVVYEGEITLYVFEQKIEGELLADLIKRKELFNIEKAIDFLKQGLLFIEQLEKRNIVHRDIKPYNIIINPDGKVYFLDFGIARILGVESITDSGDLVGPHAPGYASPEQFNNRKRLIDSRADMFSLGVVTYECITGFNPFIKGATTNFQVLMNTMTISPLKINMPGDVNNEFIEMLYNLFSIYPSDRPRNAANALILLQLVKTNLCLE
jgi:serine/threonine-protein kinase